MTGEGVALNQILLAIWIPVTLIIFWAPGGHCCPNIYNIVAASDKWSNLYFLTFFAMEWPPLCLHKSNFAPKPLSWLLHNRGLFLSAASSFHAHLPGMQKDWLSKTFFIHSTNIYWVPLRPTIGFDLLSVVREVGIAFSEKANLELSWERWVMFQAKSGWKGFPGTGSSMHKGSMVGPGEDRMQSEHEHGTRKTDSGWTVIKRFGYGGPD